MTVQGRSHGGSGPSTLSISSPRPGGVSYLGSNVLPGAGCAFRAVPPVIVTLGLDGTHGYFGAALRHRPGYCAMQVAKGRGSLSSSQRTAAWRTA